MLGTSSLRACSRGRDGGPQCAPHPLCVAEEDRCTGTVTLESGRLAPVPD